MTAAIVYKYKKVHIYPIKLYPICTKVGTLAASSVQNIGQYFWKFKLSDPYLEEEAAVRVSGSTLNFYFFFNLHSYYILV